MTGFFFTREHSLVHVLLNIYEYCWTVWDSHLADFVRLMGFSMFYCEILLNRNIDVNFATLNIIINQLSALNH